VATAPTDLPSIHPASLKQGKRGDILARCDVVGSAVSYQWRYAKAQAPTAWTQPDPTSKANNTFAGLVPGTQYSVQARAIGRKGASNWCTAASLIVN
jgi:hypothetical protein